jgi:adenylate cyclase
VVGGDIVWDGSGVISQTGPVAIEIERKFVLPYPPAVTSLGPGLRIRQGYLAEEGTVEVRVRITDVAASLTVKAGGGLVRTEVDVPITFEQAEGLWAHTEGRRIDKVRHRVHIDAAPGYVAEVDLYGGALTGLCVAEIEFSSEADAVAFDPPSWLGGEVTGDRMWSNAALARRAG